MAVNTKENFRENSLSEMLPLGEPSLSAQAREQRMALRHRDQGLLPSAGSAASEKGGHPGLPRRTSGLPHRESWTPTSHTQPHTPRNGTSASMPQQLMVGEGGEQRGLME